MLALVSDGPELPPDLLPLLEQSRVVFFCGAGISYYTGIPMFQGLCDQIWSEFGSRIANPEDEELLLHHKHFDKFLDNMERRAGQPVRDAVMRICNSAYSGELRLHKALITLARLPANGLRLVTTNFDNRFLETGLIAESDIYDAPALPPPNLHWNTLVHLHGRINNARDKTGQYIVFSSADFGSAYLTEGWASKFLTQIFREFTVVFVGYSLSDPIMTYLIDAIAAARKNGGSFREPFAFAPYKKGSVDLIRLARIYCPSKWVRFTVYGPESNTSFQQTA